MLTKTLITIILVSVLVLPTISAICYYDYQCLEQGTEEWICINNQCVEIKEPVCSDFSDCPQDQVCQNGKCVLGSPTPPIDQTSKQVEDSSSNNIWIIAGSIIIGFIILAIVLKKKK